MKVPLTEATDFGERYLVRIKFRTLHDFTGILLHCLIMSNLCWIASQLGLKKARSC